MPPFEHPFARDAKIWPSAGVSGQAQNVLVIVTTLELNEGHRRFNAKHVERLSSAAKAWVEANAAAASDFLLMNRPRKWAGDKD